MKLTQIADEISIRTGVPAADTLKVLVDALATIRDRVEVDERVIVPRLGQFIRRKAASGDEWTIFKVAEARR